MGHRRDHECVAILDVRPAKLVEVLVDGHWHPGMLEAWRAQDGRWRGYVRWTIGVGMRHLGWVDQDHLRPAWSSAATDLRQMSAILVVRYRPLE